MSFSSTVPQFAGVVPLLDDKLSESKDYVLLIAVPVSPSISLAAGCYADLVKIRKRHCTIICQKIVTCVHTYDGHAETAPPGGVQGAAWVLCSTAWAQSGTKDTCAE